MWELGISPLESQWRLRIRWDHYEKLQNDPSPSPPPHLNLRGLERHRGAHVAEEQHKDGDDNLKLFFAFFRWCCSASTSSHWPSRLSCCLETGGDDILNLLISVQLIQVAFSSIIKSTCEHKQLPRCLVTLLSGHDMTGFRHFRLWHVQHDS